ncbi:TIGR02452 family protein [Clostridium sp. ZBS15]|uniref:TIGR02452 family protein n=1 Tax=Clostridium sp. ZBS15 TaxID=2949969 RepID=UPI00207A0921|nr:TIGR02452 family protein [Clostridium sp. ZBS15]
MNNNLKNKNIAIAEDTLNILSNGYYLYKSRDKKNFKDNLDYSINNTKVIKNYKLSSYCNSTVEADIVFEQKTTVQSIIESSGNYGNIIVLNFASAKHPGGGFLNGSSAQEESLARVSGLYLSLKSKQSEYYDNNIKNTNNGIYNDSMIYSPFVPFIKNDIGDLLENIIFCSVITSPAVNRGVAISRGVSETQVKICMEKRIGLILDLAISLDESKNALLILGAFGCGVFKNNPKDIARIFKNQINKRNIKLKEKNMRILFSIPDKFNLDIFIEQFKNKQ